MADKKKKPTLTEQVADLKATIEQLDKQREDALNRIKNYEQEMEMLVKQATEKRIIEKDKYLAKIEQECDDKVANRNLVINALQNDLAIANQEIEKLRKIKTPLLQRIFGK